MKTPIQGLIAKFLGATALFSLLSVPAISQQFISAKAGSIQFVRGEVFLNGTSLLLPQGRTIQMENDQVLATGRGYAELLLAPDACLRLGKNASLRMRQTTLEDIQLELNQGSAMIEILKKLKTDPIRVHIFQTVIEIKKDGLYRIDTEPFMLRTYGGEALAIREGRKVRVKKGRMTALHGELNPEKFDTNDADALHMWAAGRSFAMFAKKLFLTKPLTDRQLRWRSRPEGISHDYYRVPVAANEDWNRYWMGVWGLFRRRAEQAARSRRADPGPLPVPPPIIAYPPGYSE